jgi:dihydroxyacetone kinase
VGRGLADAAALGNVFASPSPEQILDAARAVDGAAGVLFLYGNYTGDVMNFSMAAEELAAAGTPCAQVAVADDVASAPAERRHERRGIAGDFFVFKVAGAAAELGEPLARVEALARKANAATVSMGVALGACSLPQTGRLNFEIGPEDMEVGMGLHGEPGIPPRAPRHRRRGRRRDHGPAAGELPPAPGGRVAVLVNGLGSTSLMELYVLNRRVAERLAAAGLANYATWVGEYATSLEMAGASITLFLLDDEMARLLNHPCLTPALSVGDALPRPSTSGPSRPPPQATASETRRAEPSRHLIATGEVTPALFRSMMNRVGTRIAAERDWLSELDGVIGDGDHGVTMEVGWKAVLRALDDAPPDETVEATCKRVAKTFLDAVGASSGPLYATAFLRAGTAVSDRLNLDGRAVAAWLAAASQGIRDRGGAELGDKTMIDAWVPAVGAAEAAVAGGADALGVLRAARDGARAGMEATAAMEARRGRSAKLGPRSRGHVDPGAASTYLMIAAMADALEAGQD